MKRLTKEQAAIVSAYTGVLSGPFDEMHEYVERIMGRPIWTHEMADKVVVAEIKATAKDDYMSLVRVKRQHDC